MNNVSPKVSIVITNYNYQEYVVKAIESALAQTYRNIEIIIVDDGSTDDSLSIIKQHLANHSSDIKIKLIEQENSGSPSCSRNIGISQAEGEYILPLDADDLIQVQMVEYCLKILLENPELSFVYTDQVNMKSESVNEIWAHPEYSVELLKKENIACYCSLFKKSAWLKVGGYQKIGYEDWDFWLSFAENGFIGKRIPEPLFVYRVKDTGRYAEDLKKDANLRAAIALKHPDLYDKETLRKASMCLLQQKSEQEITPSLVSVIICCYNHGNYISDAIISVLNQTHHSTECIIVNDGSTDRTEEIVQNFITQYPDRKIRLLSKTNEGLAKARNHGAKRAQGEYILFLDADDSLHPKFLESTVAILDNVRSIGFVYTDVQHIGTSSELWSGGPFNARKLLVENQLPCTSLVRKNIYQEIGGFKDILDKGYEDWEFWISCVEIGWPGFHIAKPYFYYRKHETDSMLDTITSEADEEIRRKIYDLHKPMYAALMQHHHNQ